MILSLMVNNVLHIDQDSYSKATPKEQVEFIQKNIPNSEDFVITSNLKTSFKSMKQFLDYYHKEPNLTFAVLKQAGVPEDIIKSFDSSMKTIETTLLSNKENGNNIFKRLNTEPMLEDQLKSYRFSQMRISRLRHLGSQVGDEFISKKDFKSFFLKYLNWFEGSSDILPDQGYQYLNGHGSSYRVYFTKTGIDIGCKTLNHQELATFAENCGFNGIDFES